ncbi:uncharacterized protein BJ212DRAFT_960704 [Suillus subaureus]|uniref:Uncharacterized protein n=1 Tax=Suillus subaureus TaxID=48587 RepID=A0A9P7DU77_9AGAM|nr:uncharacterized protein BJ212DRAFT_960704 [Suillus subaureus]KAG1803356.1 hypothetical protein BJ212DRAFT_960704 [Suillus subaureus]
MNSGQPDHGLPLKTVYRDAVVDIRYLHPRTTDSTCQPVYQRFQITFTTATSPARFIDAVRPVCPCRLNLQLQPLVTRIPTVAATGLLDDISRRGTILPAVSQARPSIGGTLLRPAPTTPRIAIPKSSHMPSTVWLSLKFSSITIIRS